MSTFPTSDRYYIQQVAQITNIQKALIRKWEDRYQLVQPQRLDNGYRVYTTEDINRLLLMKSFIEQGYTAKQAAQLVLQDDSHATNQEATYLNTDHHHLLNHYVLQILEKGASCSEEEVRLILQQAYFQLGLESFLQEVVSPLLKEVGQRWETKQWSEYQESFVSIIVRDFLVQIRRTFMPKQDAPCVIGACLPGEHHEIPVHILLLQCLVKGYRTYLIGSSPAPGSIEALVEKLKPEIVLLSASTTRPFEEYPDLLLKLDVFAGEHPDIAFYLGGESAIHYAQYKQLQYIQLTDSIAKIWG